MNRSKFSFKSLFPFLMIALLIISCSSYNFSPLTINGQKEYQYAIADCNLSLKANQVEPIGKVNLQFQLKRGMSVNINALKLSLNDELVPAEKVKIHYAGKDHTTNFQASKPGTLTLTLDKSIINGRKHMKLLPSGFITCGNMNMLNEATSITLND